MTLKFPVPGDAETHEAICNPQVGDYFWKMATFRLFVVAVEDDIVVTLEATPPCTLPGDGLLRRQTRDEFKERLSYNSIPGYWVRLVRRGCNVEGWNNEVRAAGERECDNEDRQSLHCPCL